MSILVTGCAGFIGFHISIKLLKKKVKLLGLIILVIIMM